MELGKLKRVELRKLWKHEARDFSAWLALPENLELLSQEIGISLVNPTTETSVGNFSADILAEEGDSERKVLIENQLEASNHDHLGKLFTYGAGLDAEVIVWIVKTAREEHEQAINWINEHSDENINIFLIQIEAWQIDESAAAPKFNIIAKPNDWAKQIKQASQKRDVTDYKLTQQRFWEDLVDTAGVTSWMSGRKPRPQHWFDVSIGTSKAHLSLTLNHFENWVSCELYIPNDVDKTIFDKLYSQKETIEHELGFILEWQRLKDKKASRIKATIEGNLEHEDEWPKYFTWLIDTSTKFKKAFAKRIR